MNEKQTLRDRRRLKMQAEIRRQAYKLFAQYGYSNTSVEQIAAAADISYSTFFRYFSNKQAIAGDFRLDLLFIEAFDALPQDMPLSQAILAAIGKLSDKLTPTDVAELREHHSLLMRIPELQATGFAYLASTAKTIAELITCHLDSASQAQTLAIDALAWSIVASWVAAFHYWIAHPEADLSNVAYDALQGVALSAIRLEAESE